MNSPALTVAGRHAARLCRQGLLIAGLAAALAGCKTTASDTTGGIPVDYRDRHPIAIKEGKKTLTLFVGPGRGGLSPAQRAEVLAFAQNWKRDASGGVTIETGRSAAPTSAPSATRSKRRCRSSCRRACPTAVSAFSPTALATTKPHRCG